MKKINICMIFLVAFLSVSAHKDKWDAYKHDWSALMLAVHSNQLDSVKILIANGADVNYRIIDYQQRISYPKRENNPLLFNDSALDFGVETIDTVLGLSALEVAVRIQDVECVKVLLATNKILDVKTPFFSACGDSSQEIVAQLMKYGANPNDTLINGYSPLIMAVNFGSIEIVELLLSKGADINHPRSGGMTPLMFAVFNGRLDEVNLLLLRGADKNRRDEKGDRAYDYVDQIYERMNVSMQMRSELKEALR